MTMGDAPINLQEWLGKFKTEQGQTDKSQVQVEPDLKELTVTYDILPPTSNRIYFKGTILTREAREYAERFSHHVRQYLPSIFRLDPEAAFHVELYFYFPSLENDTWNDPKVAPSKRAKQRYKKIDLDNRIKLLLDCFRDAIGIDDSQVFSSSQEKRQDPIHPRVEILLRAVSPELFGLRTRT